MRPEVGMRTLAFLALAIASASAVAGPPFLTDDPEPVDRDHAEVNLIGQRVRTATGRAGSVTGEVNIGCAAETQCHFAVPVAFDHPAGGRSRAGLGDIEVGLKYRFFDLADEGWSAAVYPTLALATGDAGRGLGNGHAQLLLPLWMQRSFGPWSLDAGIGRLFNRAPGARDSWFAGMLAQRSFGDGFILGAELYRRTSSVEDQPAMAGFNVGAVVNVAAHQNLLVSAGRGLMHVEANRCAMFLAYQLEL